MRTVVDHWLTWVWSGRKVATTNPSRLSLDRRTRTGALFSEACGIPQPPAVELGLAGIFKPTASTPGREI
jgi:hypothetical protein